MDTALYYAIFAGTPDTEPVCPIRRPFYSEIYLHHVWAAIGVYVNTIRPQLRLLTSVPGDVLTLDADTAFIALLEALLEPIIDGSAYMEDLVQARLVRAIEAVILQAFPDAAHRPYQRVNSDAISDYEVFFI